jgi:hypothetical protein
MISINKKVGIGKSTSFWHDKWIMECSLATQYSLLYELVIDPNVTVDYVYGYNRYYLFFRRTIIDILRIKLNELYNLLNKVSLSNTEDTII